MIKFLVQSFSLVVVIFTSCSPPQSKSITEEIKLESQKLLAVEEGITYEVNPTGNFILCKREVPGTATRPENQIDFVVYSKEKESFTIDRKSLYRAIVEWHQDYLVKVVSIPGNMPEGKTLDDYAIYYDARTGKEVDPQ